MNLSKIFQKKILVCCGSGGVGKTTIAAAIALQAAYEGKKVIVLTIDPAKRLATAMGLNLLENTPSEVPLKGASGQLFAMMLDTKRTFDRLIERHSKDPQKTEAIFKNKLYQTMSSMISGSQEYMAMEKLHEIYEEGGFDLIVLDTPPTRHALDFLEAPQKMINITSNSLLEWFLKPGLFAGKLGLGLLQKGADKILSVLDRLAGFSFLHELSEMVALLSDLLGGFRERSQAVYELLHQDFVGFFLVSSPASVSIQDALYFHERINDQKLPFLGFIVNRVHALEREGEDTSKAEKLPTQFSPELKEKIRDQLKNYEQLAKRDQKSITFLKKRGGKSAFTITIPLLSEDIHDLESLGKIGKELFD